MLDNKITVYDNILYTSPKDLSSCVRVILQEMSTRLSHFFRVQKICHVIPKVTGERARVDTHVWQKFRVCGVTLFIVITRQPERDVNCCPKGGLKAHAT